MACRCASLRNSLSSAAPRRAARRAAPRRRAARALFTGIVQGKARVASLERRSGALAWTEGQEVDFVSVEVAFPAGALRGVAVGASIALNGVCLTVTEADEEAGTARFDVIHETLRRTNLVVLGEGGEVNFERAAKVGDEIGGHTVSGHVGATAAVKKVERGGDNVRLEFELAQGDVRWLKYVLPKGFVAVDGCSLTVGEVEVAEAEDGGRFSVYLIPETLRATCFGDRQVGDRVNVEVDPQTQAIVDTVERYMAEQGKVAA